MEEFEPTYDFFTLPTEKPQSLPTQTVSKYANHTYLPKNTLKLKPKCAQSATTNSRQFDSESEKEASDKEQETDRELKEEMKTDEVLSKVLNTNFTEVDLKPKPKKIQKNGKYQENFVKTNLNKFKKKTFANKKAKKRSKVADIVFDLEELPHFTVNNIRRDRLTLEEAASQYQLSQEQNKALRLLADGGRVYYESNPPCASVYKAFASFSSGLTVVIVPNLSLLYDRLVHLPAELSGALMSGSMGYKVQQKVIAMLKENTLDIVFVTPEKYLHENWDTNLNISLIVVEEVHAVSELSFSQRAAYVQLPSKVRRCALLGLTTCVAPNVRNEAAECFHIPEANIFVEGYISSIKVTVSRDPELTTACCKLVRKPGFSEGQVIIYVSSQTKAFSITDWLRAKGEKVSAYTSKLSSIMRDKVQKEFLERTIRIVVATSGFLVYDAQVTAVIHACLPRSLESFIQQTVHSQPVSCHMFLSLSSVYYQRSQMFINYLSKNDLIRLFKKFSAPRIQLAIDETADSLGIDKSAFRSLLNKLEKEGMIHIMAPSFMTGQIIINKMTPEQAAKDYSVLSHVIDKGKFIGGAWRFNLGKVASEYNCTSAELVSALKKLEASRKLRLELRDESYEIQVLHVPTDDELLEKTSALQETTNKALIISRTKIETCFDVFTQYATETCTKLVDCTEGLTADILQYLRGELTTTHDPPRPPENLALEVKVLIRDFTGMPQPKQIVHILQGTHTEQTPFSRWKATGSWGRYIKYDFFALLELVTEVLSGEIDTKIEFSRKQKYYN